MDRRANGDGSARRRAVHLRCTLQPCLVFRGKWQSKGRQSKFPVALISYTFPSAVTITASAESVYDWKGDTWAVPVNLAVSRLVSIGDQPVSLQAGLRYWAESPNGGPDDLAFRLGMTFLFPR